jgi:hypothetical protein
MLDSMARIHASWSQLGAALKQDLTARFGGDIGHEGAHHLAGFFLDVGLGLCQTTRIPAIDDHLRPFPRQRCGTGQANPL